MIIRIVPIKPRRGLISITSDKRSAVWGTNKPYIGVSERRDFYNSVICG